MSAGRSGRREAEPGTGEACGCGCADAAAPAAAGRAAMSAAAVAASPAARAAPAAGFSRRVLALLGLLLGGVLLVVVVGERLGLLAALTGLVPWPAWLALIAAGGFPVFRGVLRAAARGRVTSHTLMTVGLAAALAVGEWATAALVVLFMRVGGYVERYTAERARHAIRELTARAPRLARLERDGAEVEVPVEDVRPGDVVVVRPGELIPVDGVVVGGAATVDQATITGESMPVEVGPGGRVFAATAARLGSLRVRAERVGPDTTFGRIVRLVEEADAGRAEVQRLADRFSGYVLPVMAAWALLTLLVRRDPLATAAVLLVACSCAFALATPIAVLASIGAAARRGLLVKGGLYLELLARADVFLIDKTGTLTMGRPRITDVIPLDGLGEDELLALAGGAERYSEHPLAEAVRAAARERGLELPAPEGFRAIPGSGVQARVNGRAVGVVSPRALGAPAPAERVAAAVARLEAEGKTPLVVTRDGRVAGVLGSADALRPEVPAALAALRAMGVRRVELLTGDSERVAAGVAARLGVGYRAGLLPEEKVAVVRRYQDEGRVVAMVGDGVNDAPALAQAHVGIAMGAAGSDVAIETAHLVLMGDDWSLVPQAVALARRTMRVVRLNLLFTVAYNLIGATLASLGLLPPVLAAASQSLPDVVMLLNSSRLLRAMRG